MKSNAYGHGLKEIVRKLESYVDAFGVVRMEEAILVRKATNKPILLMQGIYTDHEIKVAKENKIQIVIHNMNQFKLIGTNNSELGLWIKINTGMNRLGLSQEELKAAYEKGIINSNSVLMTHIACANDQDDPMNRKQINHFAKHFNRSERKTKKSNRNNAAVITITERQIDWVRT